MFKDLKHSIVLRKIPYKNADAFFLVFTKESGKIMLTAKGIKKVNSKLAPFLQVGSILKINITNSKKSKIPIITGVQSLFLPQIASYEDLIIFEKALSITNLACKEDQIIPQVFSILQNFITNFINFSNKKILLLAYKLKLFFALGFLGNFNECMFCNKKLSIKENNYISHQGVLCSLCKNNDIVTLKISTNELKVLYFLQKHDFLDIKKLVVSDEFIKSIFKKVEVIIKISYIIFLTIN